MKQREIKFRGRNRTTEEWVYGYYVERDGVWYGMIYDKNGLGIKVDKETVEQYTGLKDKNGKEIYEGDIVKFEDTKHIGIVCLKDGEFLVEELPKRNAVRLLWCEKHAEIIGNIYENPELLK